MGCCMQGCSTQGCSTQGGVACEARPALPALGASRVGSALGVSQVVRGRGMNGRGGGMRVHRRYAAARQAVVGEAVARKAVRDCPIAGCGCSLARVRL
jgi:hypothetical protein